ncbi:DUF3017 domain-containing protein [Pseudonocardia spinosispora]|uniref:DUF3017 domain-containing protein n=1 Tax=Pseudonocardia spinosispora TaxID=103441 RepID=UPI000560E980|nr:DUF3017 domain-containing protein [Pseudonocardia spinosispora]
MMDLRRKLADRLPLHFAVSVVLVIAAAGLVRVLQEHWRQGAGLVGGALLVAAVARIILPEDRAGLLGVRSQAIDVLWYAVLGALMVILAATIPPTPLVAGIS